MDLSYEIELEYLVNLGEEDGVSLKAFLELEVETHGDFVKLWDIFDNNSDVGKNKLFSVSIKSVNE